MKLIGERGIEPPFRRTLRPMSYCKGDYSDAPAGERKEGKAGTRPPIWDAAYYATRLRGSYADCFSDSETICANSF